MLLIYTGNGKGKTCACVGQAVRALGQNMRVSFAQFMKSPDQAGEQRMLSQLLGTQYRAGGKGFFRNEEERPQHRQAARETLDWALKRLPDSDMLVLDESLYALGSALLERAELEDCIQRAHASGTHLVLSGRGLPDWLQEKADLVTEMGEIKHPWQKNISAAKGIEF